MNPKLHPAVEILSYNTISFKAVPYMCLVWDSLINYVDFFKITKYYYFFIQCIETG